MVEDWIDVLQRGTYEVRVPTLTVSSGEIGTLNGSGGISWNANSEIRIQATTYSENQIDPLVFNRTVVPGTLISHSVYLHISGKTADNWEIETATIPRSGHHTHMGISYVNWDISTASLTLQRNTTGSPWQRFRILMGPAMPGWTKHTKTQVENDVFGTESVSLDWLSTECNIGRVAARRRSDEWFEVRIIPPNQKQVMDEFASCTAVATAFGFILGRRCIIRGYEHINGNHEIRRLDARQNEFSKNALFGPIGGTGLDYLKNVEKLLGLAINFFLTDLGKSVAQYLLLCWDTVDNIYTTRLAMSSLCLEGLIRMAAKQLGPDQPQILPSDLSAFSQWLEMKPDGFSEQFLIRLNGLKSIFGTLSVKEIFRHWCDHKILGVTQDDIDAWSDIRNPSAHGRVITSNNQVELQTHVNHHARIQNLLNKILLQFMGYQGQYINYAQTGFPSAVFPCPPPDR
ncbi:MAG: hypothetical protein M1472_01895 [Planctomycetes bacterium]|nr:hypothetical protein [Planctomycetota bacterium]